MNRDEKAAAIAEIAGEITESQAILAVDPTGLSVSQAGEIRTKLRDADARLRIVKNTLTTRAADQAGVESLKELLVGPTALTFVRGDAAAAAKAISDYAKATDKLPFKGGYMDGAPLSIDEIKAIAKLPSRDVLYGQLVGMIASPITGLARGLNALLSGVAIALGQVQAKAEAGEIQLGGGAGEPAPAAEEPAAEEPAAEAEAPAEEAPADEAPAEEAPAEVAEEPAAEDAPAAEADAEPDADAEPPTEGETPHTEEPAEGSDGGPAPEPEPPTEGETPHTEEPAGGSDKAPPNPETTEEKKDMPPSPADGIEELRGIPVLELSERIKALEEEFGVPATA